jgi:hypothetical protein
MMTKHFCCRLKQLEDCLILVGEPVIHEIQFIDDAGEVVETMTILHSAPTRDHTNGWRRQRRWKAPEASNRSQLLG